MQNVNPTDIQTSVDENVIETRKLLDMFAELKIPITTNIIIIKHSNPKEKINILKTTLYNYLSQLSPQVISDTIPPKIQIWWIEYKESLKGEVYRDLLFKLTGVFDTVPDYQLKMLNEYSRKKLMEELTRNFLTSLNK
jgi:hypothetical protein